MLAEYGHMGKMLAFNLREGFKPDLFKMPARAAGDPPFKIGPCETACSASGRNLDMWIEKAGN